MEEKNATDRGRGRPRIHKDDKARVRAWKQEKQRTSRRLDCHISSSASWRIMKLARAWNCSLAKATERLIMEADDRYEKILFPDQV